jgi:hypothetical protein
VFDEADAAAQFNVTAKLLFMAPNTATGQGFAPFTPAMALVGVVDVGAPILPKRTLGSVYL